MYRPSSVRVPTGLEIEETEFYLGVSQVWKGLKKFPCGLRKMLNIYAFYYNINMAEAYWCYNW